MTTTLKRLSVCTCGFPCLKDNIPLGQEYEIDPAIKTDFIFTCGSCGAQFRISAVYVHGRGDGRGGFLPEELFTATN